MKEAWQVLSDCPHCLVEGAVLELMDPLHPASHFGIPAVAGCRLCQWERVANEEPFVPKLPVGSGRCPNCSKPLDEQARSGEGQCPSCHYEPTLTLTRGPLALTSPALALQAMTRWAAEEGEADVNVFALSNLGGEAAIVAAAISRGEPTTTSFDVMAFLFPSGASGGGQDRQEHAEARPMAFVDRAPVAQPVEEPAASAPTATDPRLAGRLLVSVMVADGELRAGERRFVERFLQSEGLPPLPIEDVRVWRPHELPPPADLEVRERLIEATVHLMHLDRQRDGSEWRVVSAFASAWGIPDAKLRAWDAMYDRRYASAAALLWRALGRALRVG